MAKVNVHDFSLEVRGQPPGYVMMNVRFSLSFRATEKRLGIPFIVNVRLMERDAGRDEFHLWLDSSSHQENVGNTDDSATGWLYVGTYDSEEPQLFSKLLKRSELPNEKNAEEWYAVLLARPAIDGDISYSQEISLPLAS